MVAAPGREGDSLLDPDPDTTSIPLVEEEVRVAKREVVTGRVRVRTVVDTTEELVRDRKSVV